MANVAVVGGAGYIGSHTTKALQDSGHNVTVLDNLSLGHRNAITTQLIEVDIREASQLRAVFEKGNFDGVIHFAALSQVGDSVKNPLAYYDTNVGGTLNLLEAMVGAGVKKIVFSSTAAVYGQPVVDATGITEDFLKLPINPYGNSKLAMERMIEDVSKAHGLRAIALRYFNACGADPEGNMGEDHLPESHLIPIVVAAGLGKLDPARNYRGQINVFGTDYDTPDGTCIRDYIDVNDLASAHVAAFEHLGLSIDGSYQAMNVGTGRGVSVNEVIQTASEVLGREIPVTYGERRAGDPAILLANSKKLQNELNWKPKRALADSISSVVKWMTKNPNGYNDR
jgi:UDP-glucose 4-epimerase